MALKATLDTETNPPQPAAPGVNIDPTQSSYAPGLRTDNKTTRLFSILNQFSAGQSMGPEIEKYIEALKSYFPKDAAGTALAQVRIQRLSEPQGAHAFIVGDAAIILLFEALLPRDQQNFLPTSDYGSPAAEAFRREVPNTRLLHVVLVQTEDYIRAQQMATYLLLQLTFNTNAAFADSTISLLADNEFVIDPSVDVARAFIEQNNPHTTQPRIDIGFTIFANPPRRSGPMALTTEVPRPIAAVGAYTEIWLPEDRSYAAGPIKYAATVHVTNITSTLPLPGIIPLCLSVAADQFLDQRRWVSPFMSFKKGSPNLGNLSVEKDKLWFANTVDELNAWIATNMLPRPFLAVDVVEGQARIPAIAAYGDQQYSAKVYDQITTFFGNLPLERNVLPFTVLAQVFLGLYGDRMNKLIDSRDVDYLNLLAQSGAQDPNARLLLQYNVDPAIRARVVYDKTGGTFRSLWRTQVSILDPGLLAMLAREIVNRVKIVGTQRQDRVVATPWVNDLQARYLQSTFNTTQYSPQAGYGAGGVGRYNV